MTGNEGTKMLRAKTFEELKPLIALCRAGKLFDVQAWVAAGKPVNPPPPVDGHCATGPLFLVIATGFHSMVQVLLEAGAEIDNRRPCSDLREALQEKQYEIAKLLVEHGADVNSVDLADVFDTWHPGLVEFFIERGADLETGNPLAQALCRRNWMALKVLRTYKTRFPSFQEQANIALRHHCREGNLKWVAQLLRAGADPHAPGPDEPENPASSDSDYSALELAAFHGQNAVFGIKGMRLDPKSDRAHSLVRKASYASSPELLGRLLDMGFPVNDQANGGSSHVEKVLDTFDWWGTWQKEDTDQVKLQQRLEMLEVLIQHGARWIPIDRDSLNNTRRRLLRVAPRYTSEVVRIMAKYGGCRRAVIDELLRTPAMHGHVMGRRAEIDECLQSLPH